MVYTFAARGCSPHAVAVGLLSLGLVITKLLPLESLRPSGMCADEFHGLFLTSQNSEEIPICALNHAEWFQRVLEAATCCEWHRVQEAFVLAVKCDIAAQLGVQLLIP